MAQRLASETSPYLQQHLNNPVDWYPWGEEALEEAKRNDRPILLSIGYSSCHWCHVMAHESFENESIAALMNEHFINVKVDREERPDVDAVYMEAVQAMTGHGGWPLTAFLTPEGEPFYGGTYFPPAPRQGMPGFPQLLEGIAAAWRDRRDEVLRSSAGLREALQDAASAASSDTDLLGQAGAELLSKAAQHMLQLADSENGGFGRAPKFPQASALSFLMARYRRNGDVSTLAVVRAALDGMGQGGIRDHLAGGFHRYSVDAHWTIPHFEKMLYDNAQLARLYLEAYQATGAEQYRAIAEETLDYLLSEMRHSEGGFYSAQDADTSEGEGAFFSWRPDELALLLDDAEAEAIARQYGVTPSGNFEGGRSVLAIQQSESEVAAAMQLQPEALASTLSSARRKLLEARSNRPTPMTDTKILAAWNGLAIDAFSRAGAVLERDDYVDAAVAAAQFVVDRLRTEDGGLARSWKDDRSAVPAFLDDHAAMGNACLSLYEATFDPHWLTEARNLAKTIIEQFSAPDGSGFLRSGPRHETLFLNQKDLQDGALPGGNALAAELMLRLSKLDLEPKWREAAEGVLRAGASLMAQAPLAAGALLSRLDDVQGEALEIAIVGDGPSASAMIRAVRSRYLPGSVLAWTPTEVGPQSMTVPLLADRPLRDGAPAAYVCQQGRCSAPVTHAEALLELLG